MAHSVSVVLPAKNEAKTLPGVVAGIRALLPDAEIVVVDDGSTDETRAALAGSGARIVRHPASRGNGAAVKTGARAASGDTLVFMDADGQHDPGQIGALLAKLEEGYDMVIGARGRESQQNAWRWIANSIYNRLASWITGHRIDDLTSGMRAVRAERFREFLYLLPNGFSYPTTSTMAFFRAGYGVAFEPIAVRRREGRGHINLLRDGGRFFLIIFRIGTLYSPLKIFFPVSSLFFIGGLAYCTYTLMYWGRLTNFGALLLITSVLVFLIGLVSEQITGLLYSRSERTR